jgi:hypothetical protein
MLRWCAPCRYYFQITRLPPVEVNDMGRAPFFQEITYTEGHDPFRARKSCNKTPHGLIVEMIVMVVRDENGINRRELGERDARWRVTPGSGKLNRGSSIAPDGIGKNADSLGLDEEAAMAYPCDRERATLKAVV